MGKEPEFGLVVRYDFLFKHDEDRGAQEGAVLRKCVIVGRLKENADGNREYALLPISHLPPHDRNHAVRIQPDDAKPLGLDNRSWIKTNTVNWVEWPKNGLPEGIKAVSENQLGIGFMSAEVVRSSRQQLNQNLRARGFERVKRPHEPLDRFKNGADRAIEHLSEKPGRQTEIERPDKDTEPER
ncbi:MAG: hypothetical protein JJ931_05335 [Henriciella sp.]|nr:hypothetical protein [Henriciella sp.]MBO6694823.1 hypothetical protein [Henriciella sp.]